jgi:hypothetical protein
LRANTDQQLSSLWIICQPVAKIGGGDRIEEKKLYIIRNGTPFLFWFSPTRYQVLQATQSASAFFIFIFETNMTDTEKSMVET